MNFPKHDQAIQMTDGQQFGVETDSGEVLSEWIDVNEHMNVAYYVLTFDRAIDKLWDRFGITSDYITRTNNSTFAVECHITYLREMRLHAPFRITAQVLGYDQKRIHHFLRMYHATEGYLAATTEWMNLHIDMTTRHVSPWMPEVLDRIRTFTDTQGEWPLPAEVGHRIGIPKPLGGMDLVRT